MRCPKKGGPTVRWRNVSDYDYDWDPPFGLFLHHGIVRSKKWGALHVLSIARLEFCYVHFLERHRWTLRRSNWLSKTEDSVVSQIVGVDRQSCDGILFESNLLKGETKAEPTTKTVVEYVSPYWKRVFVVPLNWFHYFWWPGASCSTENAPVSFYLEVSRSRDTM